MDIRRTPQPPQFVLSIDGELRGEDTPENREIVRRIHACIDACEGLSTDELERGIVQTMREIIGQVEPLLRRTKADAAVPT